MPLNRTLGELRADLGVRLGFGSAATNNGALIPILNNMLYAAQVELYWGFDWRSLRVHVTETLGEAQLNMDFPEEIHPDRIQWISVLYSNVWTPPLERGISAEMYTSQDRAGVPTHWDLNSASGDPQIEFWPEPDDEYSVRLFGMAPLSAFAEDGDRTTIDSDIVFLKALADAKAHYRHPDAAMYAEKWNRMEADLRNKNWVKRVYRPGDSAGTIIPKPHVSPRDD